MQTPPWPENETQHVPDPENMTSTHTGTLAAPRVLFVASYFPPVSGGSAVTLANLVSALDDGSAAVVAEHPGNFLGTHNADIPAGVKTWRVPVPGWFLPARGTSKLRSWMRQHIGWLAVPAIRRAIRHWQPTHVVPVYPSSAMMVNAYRAVQGTGCAVVPYFFDAPTAAITSILGKNAPVMALTEGVASVLREMGVSGPHCVSHVGHRPAPSGSAHRMASRARISELLGEDLEDRFVVAHTGAVEGLQRDGLLDLIEALPKKAGKSPLVVLSTPSPMEAGTCLEGHMNRNVRILNLEPSDVRRLQAGADALYATLPLRDIRVDIGRTCFPTKITDYLTSGTPIIVRGTAGSVLCRHATRQAYAMVVTSQGGEALAQALTALEDDGALRTRLITHAWKAAEEFCAASVVPGFLSALNAGSPVQPR